MSAGENFICAICEQTVDMRWNSYRQGRDTILPPICNGCEGQYTDRIGKPKHGALRDRREAIRICALAEALIGNAYSLKWSQRYGQA